MKITKRQLRRIIKEEKAKLTEMKGEGAYGAVHDPVFQFLDQRLEQAGHDRANAEVAEDVATALVDIADKVRELADAPARGWEEPRR